MEESESTTSALQVAPQTDTKEEKMQEILKTLKLGDVLLSVCRREFLNEYIVKILKIYVDEVTEENTCRLRLMVSDCLRQLTQDWLVQMRASQMGLIRDFLQSVIRFFELKEFYCLGVEDLSLITGRLVINPRNVFILLQDIHHPELIERQVRDSRIGLEAFCRQVAHLVLCLAVKRLDLLADDALLNFESLLDSHEAELSSLVSLKSLIQALLLADSKSAQAIARSITNAPVEVADAKALSELEQTIGPEELASSCFESQQRKETQESVVIHSNATHSQIQNATFFRKMKIQDNSHAALKQKIMGSNPKEDQFQMDDLPSVLPKNNKPQEVTTGMNRQAIKMTKIPNLISEESSKPLLTDASIDQSQAAPPKRKIILSNKRGSSLSKSEVRRDPAETPDTPQTNLLSDSQKKTAATNLKKIPNIKAPFGNRKQSFSGDVKPSTTQTIISSTFNNLFTQPNLSTRNINKSEALHSTALKTSNINPTPLLFKKKHKDSTGNNNTDESEFDL